MTQPMNEPTSQPPQSAEALPSPASPATEPPATEPPAAEPPAGGPPATGPRRLKASLRAGAMTALKTAATTLVAAGGAFVVIAGAFTPTMGATRSSKLIYEQRRAEVEKYVAGATAGREIDSPSSTDLHGQNSTTPNGE